MESTIEIYSPEWFINRQGNFTGSEIWKLMTEARSKKDVLSCFGFYFLSDVQQDFRFRLA